MRERDIMLLLLLLFEYQPKWQSLSILIDCGIHIGNLKKGVDEVKKWCVSIVLQGQDGHGESGSTRVGCEG